ncbi:recombinase XerD [Streptomyces sp. NPDC007905]|uniref:recombinase XerD n=1 Tax=Streptomyces sp. NPDC007905 TaxID=3364788 RepID=UPI0036E6ABC2
MDYFFVSRSKVRRFYEAPPGVDLDAMAYVSRPGALKEGTPFFFDSQMRPAEPLVSFFLEMAKTLKAKSLQDYTYDALDLTEYLENELDPPVDLLSVIEEDLVAYREDCTEHRESPDAPATWKRRRAMINGFYGWAEDQKLIDKRPYFRRRNGRDVLSWGATTQLDVRHLTWRQWNFLKQVGLRGYLPNGRVDRAFRGRSPLRNSAAPELAITTGMRLQEFSCLLDIEVGPPRRDGSRAEVLLQAIAKYGLPRTVTVQDPTLRELDMYRRTERAAQIRAAAKALWRRREELFIVDDVDLRRMKLRGKLDGRRCTFRVESMNADKRRLAVIEGDHGLEPMALFVGRGGRMPTRQRWEQIFGEAHLRALRLSEEYKVGFVMPREVRIHDTRHTFAVYMLRLLTKLIVQEEAEKYLAGGHTGYLTDHISRNPLLILQALLGHRSPSSTLRYLRYMRDTNALVAKAIAEWNNRDATYADYAAAIAEQRAA